MARPVHSACVGFLSVAICLVALTGCGGTPAHLATGRKREESAAPTPAPSPAPEHVAAASLPPGAAIAQDLVLRGGTSVTARSGYAVECGVYPGLGYSAILELSLPGRLATLNMQLPMYNGPGKYHLGVGTSASTNVAVVTLTGLGSGARGTVVVSPGGRSGTIDGTFGNHVRGDVQPNNILDGNWACAPAGVGYTTSNLGGAGNQYESLTVSGALQGHVSSAYVPEGDLLAGSPNCATYQSGSSTKFNAAMVLDLDGHHYLLDVQLQQYQGAGMYYPSFTTRSLPIETNWATGEVARAASSDSAGEIPSSTWAAVGGDFRLDPGLRQGLMAIRFMNRTGASFIVTGAWSC